MVSRLRVFRDQDLLEASRVASQISTVMIPHQILHSIAQRGTYSDESPWKIKHGKNRDALHGITIFPRTLGNLRHELATFASLLRDLPHSIIGTGHVIRDCQ